MELIRRLLPSKSEKMPRPPRNTASGCYRTAGLAFLQTQADGAADGILRGFMSLPDASKMRGPLHPIKMRRSLPRFELKLTRMGMLPALGTASLRPAKFPNIMVHVNVLISVVSVLLGLLGLLFVIGWQHQVARLVIGGVLIAAAILMFAALRLRPKQTTIVQKIDLTGDVAAQNLKCKNCGATLSNKSVTVQAGAIFISCEFCGTQYQLEEAPKW